MSLDPAATCCWQDHHVAGGSAGCRRPRDLFSARHCSSGSARHVTRYTQACGLPC